MSFVQTNCPNCENPVYFAERILCMGRWWHRSCLRCTKCNKVLEPTRLICKEGKVYCPVPCYNNLFFTKGYRRVRYY
ncbi:cysteine-rich protein 1-like isoform X1 [Parasteatoda tepidariorum]|uniref:cysteine-rich protein 1-like isoform X1 n=1 Tax=Parasteatoda tepidariorum TaxID=114398 RepID=UPI00077FB1E3|nr:cysteine-rich protein 1-like isoform X1 [Parasteatoda tepidariorum]